MIRRFVRWIGPESLGEFLSDLFISIWTGGK